MKSFIVKKRGRTFVLSGIATLLIPGLDILWMDAEFFI